jgi:hypothetical protein
MYMERHIGRDRKLALGTQGSKYSGTCANWNVVSVGERSKKD